MSFSHSEGVIARKLAEGEEKSFHSVSTQGAEYFVTTAYDAEAKEMLNGLMIAAKVYQAGPKPFIQTGKIQQSRSKDGRLKVQFTAVKGIALADKSVKELNFYDFFTITYSVMIGIMMTHNAGYTHQDPHGENWILHQAKNEQGHGCWYAALADWNTARSLGGLSEQAKRTAMLSDINTVAEALCEALVEDNLTGEEFFKNNCIAHLINNGSYQCLLPATQNVVKTGMLQIAKILKRFEECEEEDFTKQNMQAEWNKIKKVIAGVWNVLPGLADRFGCLRDMEKNLSLTMPQQNHAEFLPGAVQGSKQTVVTPCHRPVTPQKSSPQNLIKKQKITRDFLRGLVQRPAVEANESIMRQLSGPRRNSRDR